MTNFFSYELEHIAVASNFGLFPQVVDKAEWLDVAMAKIWRRIVSSLCRFSSMITCVNSCLKLNMFSIFILKLGSLYYSTLVREEMGGIWGCNISYKPPVIFVASI